MAQLDRRSHTTDGYKDFGKSIGHVPPTSDEMRRAAGRAVLARFDLDAELADAMRTLDMLGLTKPDEGDREERHGPCIRVVT